MKFIFLFFILLFFQPPRYLHGDYADTYHGMVGASWHFEKDGTFTYSEANCEGGRGGSGIYKLQGDSIHLLFHSYTVPHIPSSLEAYNRKIEVPAWALDFHLKDRETNEDVIFATIVVKDADGNILQRAEADIDGNAHLKIPGYNGAVLISVKFPGYSDAELKLQKPGSYSLTGIMTPGSGPSTVPTSTHYDYRFLSTDKKSMRWQTSRADSSVIIEVKKFKRPSAH